MGRGSSKTGSKGLIIPYSTFMQLNDEGKDQIILRALEEAKVPNGVKDSDTMRVMIALGLNNRPTMVDDETLDKISGKDLYRTINDATGKTSNDIYNEFTTANYTSLSDINGSSEGRGYYFAKGDLNGSTFWADGNDSLTMRAKVKQGAKLADIDKIFNGGGGYDQDRNFWEKVRTKTTPWDALSIWLIKKGYQGGKATDTGTGTKELVILDRGILNISKTVKKVDANNNKKLKWKNMEDK